MAFNLKYNGIGLPLTTLFGMTLVQIQKSFEEKEAQVKNKTITVYNVGKRFKARVSLEKRQYYNNENSF